jgi:hypothetical protein
MCKGCKNVVIVTVELLSNILLWVTQGQTGDLWDLESNRLFPLLCKLSACQILMSTPNCYLYKYVELYIQTEN